MFLFMRRFLCMGLVAVSVAFVACSGVQSFDKTSWTEAKISDIKNVAGNWEGPTWMEPRTMREQNWAKVKILENGTYEFATFRNIGAWVGKGTVKLEDGKLVAPPSEKGGSLKMTLYKSDDKRMLRVEATNKEGRLQRAELTPPKKKDDGY